MHHHYFWIALVLYTYCSAVLHLHNGIKSSSQAILNPTNYSLRNATKEDIDDIITVFLDAFSPGPLWQYVRPEYWKYKEYTRYCLREALTQQWNNINPNTTFLKVIEVSDTEALNRGNQRVVAIAFWQLMTRDNELTSAMESFVSTLQNGLPTWKSQLHKSYGSMKYNCSANLDQNLTRAVDFDRQFYAAKIKHIDKAYSKQLYLGALATHPDWDGHGFAAVNLHWGLEFAKTIAEPVTLIATPAGYPLYNASGFRSLTNISIKTLDGWGKGSLWFEVMDYS